MGGTNSKFPTKGELGHMSKESLNELMINLKEEMKSNDDAKIKQKLKKNIKKLKEFLKSDHHHSNMDMDDHLSAIAHHRKSPVSHRRKSPVAHSAFAHHRKSPVAHRKSPVAHSSLVHHHKLPVVHPKLPVDHSAFAHHRKSPVAHRKSAVARRHDHVKSLMSHFVDDNSSVASSVNMDKESMNMHDFSFSHKH